MSMAYQVLTICTPSLQLFYEVDTTVYSFYIQRKENSENLRHLLKVT